MWKALEMNLHFCSQGSVYINTNPPERRNRVLKSKRDLEDLVVFGRDTSAILKPNFQDVYYPSRLVVNGTVVAFV